MNTKEQLKAQREIAAIYQRGQQNACDKLDALRAAVDVAPHTNSCDVNFIDTFSGGFKPCDCWKSRLPK